jgi:tetratricopeptide (TPR) repeat protein
MAVEQASAALIAGNAADAERTFRQHLLLEPTDLNVLARLGDLLGEQHRNLEAAVVYKRALAVAPGADNIRLALAHLLERMNQPKPALNEVGTIEGPLRIHPQTLIFEAALLGRLGIHDREIAIYQRLTAVIPDNWAVWMNLGNALKTVGRFDEAVAALRKAIKARPAFAEAYWTLANFKSFRFAPRDVAAMLKALKGKPEAKDALHFHFALGKALEDRGDAEGSFRHYAAGNHIRAAQMSWDQMILSPRVDSAITTFATPLLERHAGGGDPARDPIFIVGLQRSGSTLIEQILASHPMIEGTSELLLIEQMWNRLGRTPGHSFDELARLDTQTLQSLGAEYLERSRSFRRTDRPMFVDKLPSNWLNIGFIKLILPNARIVDARRHPLACGFSNFKQHYATGVNFSYSLEAIGRFYSDYLRLMNHFDEVLPGAVHHLINERLIDDPEGTTRSLLDYVSVPFDPACLQFHKTDRAIHTPSAEQVRKGISREGMNQWRQYEPWLGPLKEALGESLDTWDKMSPRQP